MAAMDIGPQRIKVVEAVRALKTALKCAIWSVAFSLSPLSSNCIIRISFKPGNVPTESDHYQLRPYILPVSFLLINRIYYCFDMKRSIISGYNLFQRMFLILDGEIFRSKMSSMLHRSATQVRTFFLLLFCNKLLQKLQTVARNSRLR